MGGQVVEEFHVTRVCPMHVLEHKQRGLPEGQLFDEPSGSEEQQDTLGYGFVQPKPQQQG